MNLDFSRCRNVWVPPDPVTGKDGFWSPPPPHVRAGVKWILANPFALLADDMGGMKTAQAIISAQFLHDHQAIDRVIVVAPAAVRPKVWFDQDLGQLREQVFEDKRNRITEYSTRSNPSHTKMLSWAYGPENKPELKWIITNYEFIRDKENLAPLLQYCGPRTLLILDESSAVRVHNSASTEACMWLRWKPSRTGKTPDLGNPRCGRILELNGTPVAETPRDMFSQGNLLHPDILECRFISHYEARYAIKAPVIGPGGKPLVSPYLKKVAQPDGTAKMEAQHIMQTVDWSNLEDLQKRFEPYVLRREAKELGIDFALPPVPLEVTLTPTTWKHYISMRDHLVSWLETGVATASQAGVKSIRLAQITSGFLGGIQDPLIPEEWQITSPDQKVGLATRDEIDWSKEPEVEYTCPECGSDIHPCSCEMLAELKKSTPIPQIQEIGREKLDFALEWHKELLRQNPNLKLLVWCRFVPELRRYLKEVQKLGHPVGAACGESVLGQSKKKEREFALRLLHPKTAPPGPATVGATAGTGAIGLNFTACRTVLDMSYDFSAYKKKQGDARVNRPGQTGPVSFTHLVAVGPKGQKTIDHHIMLERLGKIKTAEWTVAAWVKALKEE